MAASKQARLMVVPADPVAKPAVKKRAARKSADSPSASAFDKKRRFREKQDAILFEAARLISERGFANVSLDDVAQRLNIAKPVIYYYFENKEQILYQCYSKAFDVAEEAMKTALDHTGSGLERFQTYIREYLSGHLDGKTPTMPLHDVKALSAPFRSKIERRRRTRRNLLRDMVASGIEDGSIRPCDPRVVVSAWAGAGTWILESFDPDGGLSAAQLAEQVVLLFSSGIVSADNPSPRR